MFDNAKYKENKQWAFFSSSVLQLKVKSESFPVVSDSLRPRGLYSPWNSPGQNTGVGSLSLLQGIFLTQEWNQGLPHFRRILYQLVYQGSPCVCLSSITLQDLSVAFVFSLGTCEVPEGRCGPACWGGSPGRAVLDRTASPRGEGAEKSALS